MKKKLAAFALAGALLATSLVSGPAFAAHHHHKKFASTVTIHFTQNTYYTSQFFGKVKSAKRACRKHRTVVVRRTPKINFGSTKTNRRGHWVLPVNGTPPAGGYYAKAKRKRLASGAVCKRARSATIQVP